ncbi:MAG: hypothetical protein JW776_11400 [Candidatus Lokiarchaeota archaeon]|nr:hypothetical protein [Candidatus Lokiarchaeota archaeon]
MKRIRIKLILLGMIIFTLLALGFTSSFNKTRAQIEIDYEKIHQDILMESNPGYLEDWYIPKIEMLFIVPDGYESTVKPLSDWKTLKGVPSIIINQSTYLEFPGRDEAESLRNCIKYYYENYEIQWVLLAGDTSLIPTRYVYNPDTRILREEGTNDYEPLGANDIYKPTDYYYADLTGTWDTDGDNIFGESLYENRVEEIEWTPEVHVGRLPGNSIEEIEQMINKTLFYDTVQNPGEWMNSMLIGAAIQDWPTPKDLDGEQEIRLANQIIEESVKGNINYTLLAESTDYGTNLSSTTFRNAFELGQSLVLFAGHGSPKSFNGINGGVSTTIFTTTAALNLENYEMPSFVFADACSTNMFDHINDSMGEVLIKKERGGAIGYIGSMRLSFYYTNDSQNTCNLCELNRGMTRLFFHEFFNNQHYQQGKTLNEMRLSYLNSVWLQSNPRFGNSYTIHNIEWERKNVLTYNLLGDPELDIFTQAPRIFKNETFILNTSYFEGSYIQRIITDDTNNPIPFAKVALQGENSTYKTFFTDENGLVQVQLPYGARFYNYTITAHNMIPQFGTFHTVEDDHAPLFSDPYSYSPGKPTVNDKIMFNIPVVDYESYIACGVLVLSTDLFHTYDFYEFPFNREHLSVKGELPRLQPGEYAYILYVYDFGQNYTFTYWNNNMIFTIPVSVAFIFVLLANIGLLGFIGYFICKKYRENLLPYD